MKKVKIENKLVGEGEPCFIIAEVGVNHNGKLSLAKKLVDAAKKANADAVKFQTWVTEEIVTRNAEKAEYQKETTGDGSQYDMLKKLELSFNDFILCLGYKGEMIKNYFYNYGILNNDFTIELGKYNH